VTGGDVRALLSEGLRPLQTRLDEGMLKQKEDSDLGMEIVGVRVLSVDATPDLEKAMQTPARESLQQRADQAMFERRALAVEKERAIAENELENRIQLSMREEGLIRQEGANERDRAKEAAGAARIESDAEAQRLTVAAEAKAEGIRLVEGAEAEAEHRRLDAYRDLPPSVLKGLALRELAGQLPAIRQLNISPDLLTTFMADLASRGGPASTGGTE